MGMSIDEAIEILHERDKCMEYVTDNDSEAFDMAISTMRKYQKIEQILKSLDDGEINYPQMTYYLRKVLKDENGGNPDSLNLHS